MGRNLHIFLVMAQMPCDSVKCCDKCWGQIPSIAQDLCRSRNPAVPTTPFWILAVARPTGGHPVVFLQSACLGHCWKQEVVLGEHMVEARPYER